MAGWACSLPPCARHGSSGTAADAGAGSQTASTAGGLAPWALGDCAGTARHAPERRAAQTAHRGPPAAPAHAQCSCRLRVKHTLQDGTARRMTLGPSCHCCVGTAPAPCTAQHASPQGCRSAHPVRRQQIYWMCCAPHPGRPTSTAWQTCRHMLDRLGRASRSACILDPRQVL